MPDETVYVVPKGSVTAPDDDEINLVELWNMLWGSKWLIIAITSIFAAASITYAILATEWYSADVLLAPADDRSTPTLPVQLGGLATLAGIGVDRKTNAEAVAVLSSREFTRAFIEEENLMPILLAEQWDTEGKRWKAEDPSDWPDIRDAVRFFDGSVRRVTEDLNTGLVVLVVEWTDPELAAQWANLLVKRLNERMRQRTLVTAEANIAYLQERLRTSNLVTLQQSIGSLLENELQKVMIASGNEEFSFRVIDPAEPPKLRSRPNRALIVMATTLLGGLISLIVVFVREVARRQKASSDVGRIE